MKYKDSLRVRLLKSFTSSGTIYLQVILHQTIRNPNVSFKAFMLSISQITSKASIKLKNYKVC